MPKYTSNIQKATQSQNEQKKKTANEKSEHMESRKSRNPAAENKEIGEVHLYKVFKKKIFN